MAEGFYSATCIDPDAPAAMPSCGGCGAWRQFSTNWTGLLIEQIRPKAVPLLGRKATLAMRDKLAGAPAVEAMHFATATTARDDSVYVLPFGALAALLALGDRAEGKWTGRLLRATRASAVRGPRRLGKRGTRLPLPRWWREEERAMKAFGIAALAAAAAVAGCTFKSTTVKEADAPPAVVYQQPAPVVVYQAPAPAVVAAPQTITYSVSSQAQYNQAAVLAGNWCRARLGAGARVYDTRQETSRGLATFACVAG